MDLNQIIKSYTKSSLYNHLQHHHELRITVIVISFILGVLAICFVPVDLSTVEDI